MANSLNISTFSYHGTFFCVWYVSLVLFADCDITSVTYILEHLLYEPNNARNCPEESVEEVNKPSTLWGRGVVVGENVMW